MAAQKPVLQEINGFVNLNDYMQQLQVYLGALDNEPDAQLRKREQTETVLAMLAIVTLKAEMVQNGSRNPELIEKDALEKKQKEFLNSGAARELEGNAELLSFMVDAGKTNDVKTMRTYMPRIMKQAAEDHMEKNKEVFLVPDTRKTRVAGALDRCIQALEATGDGSYLFGIKRGAGSNSQAYTNALNAIKAARQGFSLPGDESVYGPKESPNRRQTIEKNRAVVEAVRAYLSEGGKMKVRSTESGRTRVENMLRAAAQVAGDSPEFAKLCSEINHARGLDTKLSDPNYVSPEKLRAEIQPEPNSIEARLDQAVELLTMKDAFGGYTFDIKQAMENPDSNDAQLLAQVVTLSNMKLHQDPLSELSESAALSKFNATRQSPDFYLLRKWTMPSFGAQVLAKLDEVRQTGGDISAVFVAEVKRNREAYARNCCGVSAQQAINQPNHPLRGCALDIQRMSAGLSMTEAVNPAQTASAWHDQRAAERQRMLQAQSDPLGLANMHKEEHAWNMG